MSAIINVNMETGFMEVILRIDVDMDLQQCTPLKTRSVSDRLRGSKLNGRVSMMYMPMRTTKSHISLNNYMV